MSSFTTFEPAATLDAAARLWIFAPDEAHRVWRSAKTLATRLAVADEQRQYAEQSTAMYRSMFSRFCRWMAGRGLKIHTVGQADIALFLTDLKGRRDRAPSLRTRRMYLAEIDRVMAHLVALELRTTRPTQELIENLRMNEQMKPRHIVLPRDGFASAMREHLISTGLSAGAKPRALRDATTTALLLTCGLTVKELQKLRVRDFTPAEPSRAASLRAPGHRLLKKRELELADWTAALLQRWIDVRVRKLGVTPAEAERAKLFVHAGKELPIRANTVHRTALAACKACGVSAGPQMLRNEYVAGLLRGDVDMERAAGLAGLQDTTQIQAVRSAMGLGPAPANGPIALAA